MANGTNHTRQRNEGVRLDRKRKVASLRLRGFSLREIVKALEQGGVVNPETQKAWSQHQVYEDMLALKAEWQADAKRDYAEHMSEQLAEAREVDRAAWATKDLALVLKAMERMAKLLGLDAPDKLNVKTDVVESTAAGVAALAARALGKRGAGGSNGGAE
ncbi:MAG: hypothetical protein WC642_14085 [Nocardioides sp.]|jgi:hypothetical protein